MLSSLRAIGVWAAVMAAATATLAVLDRVPGIVAGVPARVHVYGSIEDAEAALGERIWLPGYYPEELRWPPARVEVSFSSPATVALRIASRTDGRPCLVIAESIGQPAAPPPALLPPAEPMETTSVEVGRHRGTLARVLVGTTELHDLWWDQGERRITLRYSGAVGRLLLLAGSLERVARERRTGGTPETER